MNGERELKSRSKVKQKQIAINNANEHVNVKALAEAIGNALRSNQRVDDGALRTARNDEEKTNKAGKFNADANAGTGNNDQNTITQRQTSTINNGLCCRKHRQQDDDD